MNQASEQSWTQRSIWFRHGQEQSVADVKKISRQGYASVVNPRSKCPRFKEALSTTFKGGRRVTQDKELSCKDCGQTFTFTTGEQEFFTERGFSEPVRCRPCRDARKAEKASGGFGDRGQRDQRF
jgi:hypothetical protein